MSKAEERALEAYPPKMRYVGIDSVKDDRKIDVNKPMRDRFVKAYHQAEKDLELTWMDMREICTQSVLVEFDLGRNVTDERHYTEVLNRFNKQKGK